jgi:hypothetical protein
MPKKNRLNFFFVQFSRAVGDLIQRSFYGDSNNKSITVFHMPYKKMPSWTIESLAPVNIEKYTTLRENVSKSDMKISIHLFILSVISL